MSTSNHSLRCRARRSHGICGAAFSSATHSIPLFYYGFRQSKDFAQRRTPDGEGDCEGTLAFGDWQCPRGSGLDWKPPPQLDAFFDPQGGRKLQFTNPFISSPMKAALIRLGIRGFNPKS
jgi:hypothetical protein